MRTAVLRATSTVVADRGLLGVTMTAIAKEAGIGRATLYKYFPDVESVLQEWHSEQVHAHLEQLHALAADAGDPVERIRRVLCTHGVNLFESRIDAGAAAVVASRHASGRFEEHGSALQRLVASLIRTAQADPRCVTTWMRTSSPCSRSVQFRELGAQPRRWRPSGSSTRPAPP
ncbi:TetR/AcrR family transcriptional regulator [Cellulomonas septica]|uniref:TetR/AcrR family transcriptional regulator n=1 Tax=Cellulomonas septica TaxID=285080 RepID=UPI001B3490BD